MENIINIVVIGLFAIFIPLIGLFFGRMNEKSHYSSIIAREKRYQHILIFNEKIPPQDVAGQPFYLVTGSVVIANDRFKQIIAGLKQIIGGRLTSYESTIDRGRREAILRMKENAHRRGATMIFNVHLQTATLNDTTGAQKSQQFYAEMIAYGTAWKTPSN